jgi:hypothetical protein
LYVPEALVPEVEEALARGRRVQQLLLEAGVRWIKALKGNSGRAQVRRDSRARKGR